MVPPPILAPDTLKGVDDLIRSGLEAFSESWFNRLLLSTGLVVVGLLFEAPEIWHETVKAFNELFHSCKPERHICAWVKLAGTLGWVLIVIGVTGEFVAESFVSKADGFVRKFDEILLADAQTKTGVAFERASAAYLKAETARFRTAGLEKEAEELRKHNLELQALIQPRDLTVEQQKDIAKKLSNFTGRFVLVYVYSWDPEGIRLGALLKSVLRDATILSSRELQLEDEMADLRLGIAVEGKDTALVQVIREALFQEGKLESADNFKPIHIARAGGFEQRWDGRPPNAEIHVGMKPIKELAERVNPKR